jgi:hypothetical protein
VSERAVAASGPGGRTTAFDRVTRVGLELPGVEPAVRYDGTPQLKVAGCFMAGLATHPSAEPDTLVVRADPAERHWLLDEAPETYYLTEHYRKYPIVLARLSRLDRAALRDLLAASRRLTLAKPAARTRRGRRVRGRQGPASAGPR